jgi:phytanoyl-CoA hydroxylase
MLDQQKLTDAKQHFDRDGYVIWRGFFDANQMRELMAELDRYIKEVLPTLPPNRAFFEDKSDMATLFRLEQIQVDPWFARLLNSERFTTLAGTLLDDDVVPQQIEVFGKAPRIGDVTPPHQDGFYFNLAPNEAVTFWLAMDTVDEKNGCLRYVPGSHRKPMREHATGSTFGFSLGMTDFGSDDEKSEVAICAEPGDLIVHHSLTIHRADANKSDRLRRAMGCVYFAARAKQDEQAVQAHAKAMHDKWAAESKL